VNLASGALSFELKDGRVVWGESVLEGEPEFARPRVGGSSAGALHEACQWLKEALSTGQPARADDLVLKADHDGISERTLRRAKALLKVTGLRDEHGKWTWCPPAAQELPAPDQGAVVRDSSPVLMAGA
jgi:hypothetical protein